MVSTLVLQLSLDIQLSINVTYEEEIREIFDTNEGINFTTNLQV